MYGKRLTAMFPLSICGTIRIKDKVSFSARAIEDEIASTLIVQGIRVDYRPEGGFRFRLGVMRLLGWNPFQGISSGMVRCSEHPKALHISYRLGFLHLTLLVTLLLILCKWLEMTFSPLRFTTEYYLAVWLWLVCGNILLSLIEFRRFLRSCAQESSERVFFWRKQGGDGESSTLGGEAK